MPAKDLDLIHNECDAVDDCALELIDEDVIDMADLESHRLVFASLYTYADEKDETDFQKIYLPAICLSAPDLYNMFYQTKLKRFSPFVLNTLIAALDKAPIINTVLANFEEATGRDRKSLTAQQKILLRQEMSTQKINSRIQKIVHMDQQDFIDSLLEQDMWFDENAGTEHAEEVQYVPQKGQPGEVAYKAAYTETLSNGGHIDHPQEGWPESVDYVPESTDLSGNTIPAVGQPGEVAYKAATYALDGTPLTPQEGWPESVDYEPEIPHKDVVVGVYPYRNIRTSVEIHVFSESLQQGIIIVVQFIVSYSDGDSFGEPVYPDTTIFFSPKEQSSPQLKCGMCVNYH